MSEGGDVPARQVDREVVANSPVLQWVTTGEHVTCDGRKQRVQRRLAELYARNNYSFEVKLWNAVGPSSQTPYGRVGLAPMEVVELANLWGYFCGVVAGAREEVAVVAEQMLLLLNEEFQWAVKRVKQSRILLPPGVRERLAVSESEPSAPTLRLEGEEGEGGVGSKGK